MRQAVAQQTRKRLSHLRPLRTDRHPVRLALDSLALELIMVDFSKIPTREEREAERAARNLRVVFTASRDAVAGASYGATMVCLMGVTGAIAAHARQIGLATDDRATQVCAWVQEEVRKTVTKSRGLLPWPDVTMPDPTKAWALLTPRTDKPRDRRTQAGIDALLR